MTNPAELVQESYVYSSDTRPYLYLRYGTREDSYWFTVKEEVSIETLPIQIAIEKRPSQYTFTERLATWLFEYTPQTYKQNTF